MPKKKEEKKNLLEPKGTMTTTVRTEDDEYDGCDDTNGHGWMPLTFAFAMNENDF